MKARTLWTLVKREYWENRTGFLLTPAALGGVLLVLLLMAWVLGTQASEQFAGGTWLVEQELRQAALGESERIEAAWRLVFLSVDGIFNLALFAVLFFYLLGALSDDRKDRSILFWKSMPVTDGETVLSKLLAAMLLAPLLMLAMEFLTLLAGTLLYWLWLLFLDVPAWRLSFGSAPILEHMAGNLLRHLVHAIWMLPLYGWLLLASAAARRRPFLLATMPLLAIIVLENFFSLLSDWSLRDNLITPYILDRFSDGLLPVKIQLEQLNAHLPAAGDVLPSAASALAMFTRREMWLGMLLGGLFLAAAVAFRRYREDG